MLCYFFCVKKVRPCTLNVVFVCVSKSAFLCKKAWQKTRFFEEKAPQKPFTCVKREVYVMNYGVL